MTVLVFPADRNQFIVDVGILPRRSLAPAELSAFPAATAITKPACRSQTNADE